MVVANATLKLETIRNSVITGKNFHIKYNRFCNTQFKDID